MFRNPAVLPFSGKMHGSRSDFRNAVFLCFKKSARRWTRSKIRRVCLYVVYHRQYRRVLRRIHFSAKVCMLRAFASEFILSRYVIQCVCLCQMAVRSSIYCFKATLLRNIERSGFRVCSKTLGTHTFWQMLYVIVRGDARLCIKASGPL